MPSSGPLSSFKSVVEYLRTLSLSHLQVKQFTFGQNSDLDVETNKQNPTKYPFVGLIPKRADFTEGGAVEFTFELSVQDISVNDLDTEEDTLNTTLMIMQDLMSRIRQTTWSEVDVFLELPVVCYPFVEARNNNLCGWASTMVFVANNPFNNCDAAFKD